MSRIPPANTIPVTIPADYIDDKYVDMDLETFACLDGSVVVDGFSMRAPSLGVFAVLESFDCKAIGNPAEAGIEDWMRVFYVNHFREACVHDVQTWIADQGSEYVRDALPESETEWHSFDKKVVNWALNNCFFGKRSGEDNEQTVVRVRDNFEPVAAWFDVCFTGFEMMPGGASGGTHMFGAEAIGGIVSGVGGVLNVSYKEVLWSTPITVIGHLCAAQAKCNGAEGVSRPKCKEDIKRKLLQAKETIHSGKLLPWQIDNPLGHNLHEFQQEHFPRLQKELDTLKKQAEGK